MNADLAEVARVRDCQVEFGAGAVPETATARIPPGSLLKMLSVTAFAPKLVGRKRTGNAMDSPAPRTSGWNSTLGSLNSGDDEKMPSRAADRSLLLRNRSLSTKFRRLALPKLRLSAIAVVSRAAARHPGRRQVDRGAFGSLLRMRMVAVSGRRPTGRSER